MIKLFDRNSTKLTISEFYENFESKKYNFKAKYQRKSNVWNDDKRSFLIDSILKNYPMPPIFMRPNVDTKTGKTKYDIVDGKQRLEAIISFIEDRVPLTEYFFEDKIFINGASDIEQEISGKLFSEIKSDAKFSDFVKQFWTYSINVDYLYEDDVELVSNIFDRLNRNGEPLSRQELRNAKYNSTFLLRSIKNIAENEFWKQRYSKLKTERMEDEEFISELYFLTAEDKFFDSVPDVIDSLYEVYANKTDDEIEEINAKFYNCTEFIIDLSIDFNSLKKLNWTTHLYGLFSVAWYCVKNGISAAEIQTKLIELYSEYFQKGSSQYSGDLMEYKNSCSSRTRSKDQREKRLYAILKYSSIAPKK